MLDLCHDLISYLLFENAILEKKKKKPFHVSVTLVTVSSTIK